MTSPPATEPTLGGRYRLGEVVGRGGMADVYRATDTALLRDVAVKILRDVADDPSARERFAAEARTLAGLNHPGLVTVLDAGTSDDHPYLVMEFVDHVTLAACCGGEALAPERVAAIGAQLADALAYVHSRGVVHRDVKPGNVLLAEGDRCLLTDFGIAKLLGEVAAAHTATGFTMGTAAYLSPEQVLGEPVGPPTDIYSLGLVLLESLTGQRAYSGPPTQAALARLSTAPAVPETLPETWVDLLRAMTARDPEVRPDAALVARALGRLAGGVAAADATAALRTGAGHPTAVLSAPPSARGTALRARWASWALVQRVAAGAAAAVVVLLLGAGVAALGGSDAGGSTGSGDGAEVPAPLQQDLRDLREAVRG